ncbi:hypothetical protein A1359_16800 [Methylomonas lenta]|uniref:Methyltransferase small domain-containing protein n=1 Tax=Methylomonas lenta TaxID=980561 RepID=A0A177MZH6_9GAMM|nr:hypothetical protein [Methylomonas lenta]OAI10370.1 hypothetical protein A1359_16800 [Methylomonas lenta]
MPWLKALSCQVLALVLTPLLLTLKGNAFILILPIELQPLLAVLLSRLFRQPLWWIPIHLLFLPLIGLLVQLNLPAWIYLLGFMLLILVFWGTVKGDVPLFLSSPAVSQALSTIVQREQADSLIDLGAGIGSVVVPLANRFPQMHITAVEQAPIPWLILVWRCRKFKSVKIYRDNFWDYPLANYSVVFAFLSPKVMTRLDEKCRNELAVGNLLVASTFPVPDRIPSSVISLNKKHLKLHCYRY